MKTLRLLLIAISLTAALHAAAAPTMADTDRPRPVSPAPQPLRVNAHDMLSLVYGFIDPARSYDQAVADTRLTLHLTPTVDPYGVWLDAGEGYALNYYGMTPEVTGMAHYDIDGTVQDYGYFFFFPYACNCREQANCSQSQFCGSLLQELYDIGAQLDQTQRPDLLFDVVGRYCDKFVQLQLVDQPKPQRPDEGAFVLSIRVAPNAFTEADDIWANL